MTVDANALSGFRLELVPPEHGDADHRFGNLGAAAAVCFSVEDAFIQYGLLYATDSRIEIPMHFGSLPILFFPGYEEAGCPLTYRIEAMGKISILGQSEERLDLAELRQSWPRPQGVFGSRLTRLSEGLIDILRHVEHGWYNDCRKLPIEDRSVVENMCFESGPFHQVGGPPFWLQNPIEPACPDCGQPLAYALSLDSDSTAGWMFGDMGRLYVFICRRCFAVLCDVQCT